MEDNSSIISRQELFAVLRQYNLWWDNNIALEFPSWKRTAYTELRSWVFTPPTKRAVVLSGARQVGKTTLLMQLADDLIKSGIRPHDIIYITFDHPLLQLMSIEGVLSCWREIYPGTKNVEYLLLDEVQYTSDWQTWLKHQVDFVPNRRIVVTGSAIPLDIGKVESGVGRWHTIVLPTLSFAEFLQLKQIAVQGIPAITMLQEIFDWTEGKRIQIAEAGKILVPYFHEYLLKGGFPQTALIESVTLAQKLTRDDIIDKVLRRDMSAVYGVRRIAELQRLFLYFCLHDGGILDMTNMCRDLELKKPTVMHFIDLLEAAHLIYRLRPYGLGREVLRGKAKIYLADPSFAGSILLKGTSLLQDSIKLGAAAEAALFKHLYTRHYEAAPQFSYWRGAKDVEVDIVASMPDNTLVPFEVKYTNDRLTLKQIKGLIELCTHKNVRYGYIVTGKSNDFSMFDAGISTQLMKLPVALVCYWLSQSEYNDCPIF